MTTAYLALGSNLGPRRDRLQAAVDGLSNRSGIRVEAASPVYETEAHTKRPDEQQPDYLNAVLHVETDWSPERLLRAAKALERAEGRNPDDESRWAPRPLDVDLLAVGSTTRRTDTLTLPHPRLAERRFVLRPWADLAPQFEVPPPFAATVQSLLEACPDDSELRRTTRSLTVPAPAP